MLNEIITEYQKFADYIFGLSESKEFKVSQEKIKVTLNSWHMELERVENIRPYDVVGECWRKEEQERVESVAKAALIVGRLTDILTKGEGR